MEFDDAMKNSCSQGNFIAMDIYANQNFPPIFWYENVDKKSKKKDERQIQ
jgi:hypothetical protein